MTGEIPETNTAVIVVCTVGGRSDYDTGDTNFLQPTGSKRTAICLVKHCMEPRGLARDPRHFKTNIHHLHLLLLYF
jgi:hypothetical protein